MTRLVSLFGGTVTDTEEQVVKENQVIIAYSAGMNQYRLVVDKIEHTKNGYIYHLINLDTKEFTSTEIINPLSRKFGIGKYYDDINPEFMDAFEVVVLRQEADGKASAKVEDDHKEQQRSEEIKAIGRERLKGIIPDYAQAVIIACEREDRSDPSTDYFAASTIRTVILGFSTHTKNNFQEMRGLAGNFIETAYIKEKNEEYENRENYTGGSGYYLGESKYHGWIIKKAQIYDRKRFIEEYAYTTGQEDNICVSMASEAVAPTNDQAVASGFVRHYAPIQLYMAFIHTPAIFFAGYDECKNNETIELRDSQIQNLKTRMEYTHLCGRTLVYIPKSATV
jgi:hypothetical protein